VGIEEYERLTGVIRELKARHPRAGLKAFVLPMEEII